MSSTESKAQESYEVLGNPTKRFKHDLTEHTLCKLQWNDKTRTYSYDSTGSNSSSKPTPRLNTIHRIASVPYIRKRDITVDEMEEHIPTPHPLRFINRVREIDAANAWIPKNSSKHK